MPLPDIFLVLRWCGALFLVGAAAYPLTRRLFSSWSDEGYLFSKAVGLAIVTWIVYVLGMMHVAPFGVTTIVISIGLVFIVGLMSLKSPRSLKELTWKTLLVEEIFFFVALLFWSWIKAHEPAIRGLEKFMDYGFMQSILNSTFFPPSDMWYPPYPINYYYFGHMVTALLTKLSGLDLAYTFNLMLATIFALCFTMSFSIGKHLSLISHMRPIGQIFSGILTAFLVTLAGNMQTLYAFTKGYTGENVKPFWELLWGRGEFFAKLSEGLNTYWYANATRFIPFTIHEFPSYSFVVSDIHGHVLSIPFVLLAIGLLINWSYKTHEINRAYLTYVFYGFLCGILLMTNALDGPIYFGLFAVATAIHWGYKGHWENWGKRLGIAVFAVGVTSLPFLSHFTSFVNGLAVNCPLPFLANTKVGPLLFETVDKCQRSPFWMMTLLWGFFWFCGISLLWYKIKETKSNFTQIEKLLAVLFLFSVALIIFPELFYFKDIYPQHFRSNTMFKLGYQAFIMFSIVSAYAIATIKNKLFFLFLFPQLFLVSIFPLFSVRSYFGGLRTYEGIYGLNWLMREYPDDYKAINWLKKENQKAQVEGYLPYTLVEADGDSYTDYERFSVFTGMATPIGWAVHEWLWRGTYDVVAPRREDVRKIYESEDVGETRNLLTRYNARYVIVGSIERQKFTALQEQKFLELGKEAYRSKETVIYKIAN